MALGSGLVAAVLSAMSVVSAVAVPSMDASTPSGGAWQWPIEPAPEVVRTFDPPDQPWLSGHRGVDLSASVGTVIRSPSVGRVTHAGVIAGRGVVVVAHAGGLRSTFEPVEGGPPAGTAVAPGAPVGHVTDTPGHCAPTTCLHWGVRRGDAYLDPLQFVSRPPIVLLPLA